MSVNIARWSGAWLWLHNIRQRAHAPPQLHFCFGIPHSYRYLRSGLVVTHKPNPVVLQCWWKTLHRAVLSKIVARSLILRREFRENSTQRYIKTKHLQQVTTWNQEAKQLNLHVSNSHKTMLYCSSIVIICLWKWLCFIILRRLDLRMWPFTQHTTSHILLQTTGTPVLWC